MNILRITYILLLIVSLIFFSCEDDKGDTVPPSVSIISPLSGSTVNEIVNLEINAKDNEGINFVRFLINDNLDSALLSSHPYTYAWNTNKLEDGIYKLSVVAQDLSQNISDTAKATYTVDNTISFPNSSEIIEISYDLNNLTIRYSKSIDADFSNYRILVADNSLGNQTQELGMINEINDTIFVTSEFDPTQESWYFIKVTDIFGYYKISEGFKVIETAPTQPILKSPEYFRGSLRFEWSKVSDNDFHKYNLFHSLNEDMTGKELLTSNLIRNDTTHSKIIDITEKPKYYQVEVEDIWGFNNKSNIIQPNLPYKIVKTYGGTQNDKGFAIQQTADGYIIVGSTNSYGAGGYDIWLLKIDFTGQEQWSRTFGGINNDVGKDIKITTDPDGFIITGYTSSYSSGGDMDMWLIHTDDLGQTCLYDDTGNCYENEALWVKRIGSSGNDFGNSIIQKNQDFIVVGKSGRIPSYFVVKVNSLGDIVWQNLYGNGPGDVANYIIESANNLTNFVLIGKINHPNTIDSDISILGINSDGTQQWDRKITYGNAINEEGNFIISSEGGGYIATGSRKISNWYDLILMKVNNDGTESSSWNFGGSYNEFGNYVQSLNDGYIVSGSTESYGRGLYDAWVIKTDINGEEIYNHTFGGIYDDKILSGTTGLNGDPIFIGYVKSFGNGAEDILFIHFDKNYQN